MVVDLLRRAVDREPDRTAISFSGAAAPAGHGGSLDLTNAQLYSRVGRIAPLLRRDTRVLVLLPAGPDFFAALFAAFHAGATAVPTPPPANDSDRFVSVAVDCTADAIVTTAETAATARRIWDRSGAPPIRWILVDDLDHAEGSSREGFVAPDSLAVLQYTSGSTGRPKGVAISHEVLTAWLDVFVERVALPPGSTVVTWAPVHHALGLAVALMALPMGGRTSLLAPEDVLADPVRWLRAISATPTPVYSGAPPFAYQLCVDATEPGDRQGLDLSRWEVALIGSERIRPQILDRFAAAFGPHGFALSAFFPSYGMTEIMMASGHRGPAEPVRLTVDAAALERREVRITPDADRTVDLVASGAPGVGIDLVIVDPDTRRPCADGQVGELWVRGPVVAGGYWRRPEQTAETFGQQLADGTGPYLRTGDLAFFHQGELVVCGRLSELVIIRGRNLLPQDIESTVQAADPALAGRPTAAFSVEGDDVDHLVVVADTEPESVPEPDRLAERVRRAVTAAHDVEVDAVLLVPTGQMPQTGTGKVQRAACRRAYQDGAFTPFGTARLSVAAPATTDVDTAPPLRGLLAALPAHLRQPVAEAELRRRVSVLTGVPVDEVAPDSPLIDLGLDSLRMIKLRGLLAADGQLDKPLVELARSTIAELAAQLAGPVRQGQRAADPDAAAPGGREPATPAAPEDEDRYEPFRLTDVQHAYLMGSSGDYPLSGVNTHYYTEFDGRGLDVPRLYEALCRLVRRHDMLRAVASPDGTQRVLPEVPPVPMPLADLRTADPGHVAAHLDRIRAEMSHQTFPAGAWPLLDVRVSMLPDGVTRVHVSVDLLVVDLWSLRILSRDWRALYERPDAALPPPGISFRQYLSAVKPDANAAARDYWLNRLDSLPPGPDLPLRRLPDATEIPRFHRRAAQLEQARWDTLRERATERGLTPVSVLLAAYAAVLGSWSRRSRFTLNLPTFNRRPVHPDIEEVIGDFTSVTLLEVDLTGATTLPELATRLRDQLWRDLEHQDFDGVRVLRELARHRGVAAELFAPTVFAAAVGHTDDVPPELPLTWLGDQVYALSQTPQVLLDHQILEGADGIAYNWDSVDDFFTDGVLDEMFAAYRALLRRLTDADGATWTEPLSTGSGTALATHRSLPSVSANRTDGPCPDGLLHEPILDQARQIPDAPAVIGADRTLTFAELRDHACALAHELRALGAGPNQLVAVAMPKSVEQVVAVLAVHLAGAAYLPVDTELPIARQDRLLTQGQCRLVLCLAGEVRPEWPDLVKAVGVEASTPPRAPVEPPEPLATPTDLAYVIFTSGSTGDPKGVAVSHRAALNTCVDVNDRFAVHAADRVLGLSSLSFDLSVYDIFGVLGAGGAVVLPPPGSGRDPERWLELIRDHGVTIWNSVPALMAMLTEYAAGSPPADPPPLRLALLSGDWVPLPLPDRIRALAPGCRVVSLGGATEAAIWSICYEVDTVDATWESVPYGRPMRNQRFHVLNDLWQECPAHVTGELFIAGVGLADGYFGAPRRTAERFVVHPHTAERLYRTGDLGRWRPDGTIEFLGREDFQVKVGGFRIELGEIENAIVAAPGVRAAVVTAPGDRNHRRLNAYLVPEVPARTDQERRSLVTTVTAHLTERLPGYMVPPAMQVIDALPLSGNGKVDRSALPDPVTGSGAPVTATPDALVQDVRARIARLLRVDPERLPVGAPLPSIGIDSLRAIELRNELKRDHRVVLPIRTLLSSSLTIAQLARSVDAARDGVAGGDASELPRVSARPDRRHEPFALTDLQHAYLVGRSGDYALGGVGSHFYVEFDSPDLLPDRLHEALTRLVRRHDMLRAVIAADGTQRVLDDVSSVPMPVYDMRMGTAEEIRAHLDRIRAEMAHQAFAPDTWPLFDVRVSRLPDGTGRLHFGMDLLIADVWSIGIFVREWEALYSSDRTDLPELSLTFRDYLTAAGSIQDTGAARRAEAYWTARLDALPPGPDLPLRADPGMLDHPPAFDRRSVRLPAGEWAAIKAQAAQRDLTPNAVLLAGYAAVLGRWSRRQHFTLNLPTFNRHPLHEQVNDIIGDFTSVTLLEIRLDDARGLAGLARRAHEQLVTDLEHCEYGGVEVLRALARRGGRPEVFAPVVFTSALGQDRAGGGDLALDWLGTQVFGISQTPQVLLDNQVYELGGELVVHWDAVAELFPTGVLDEMFTAYRDLLRRLAWGWWDLPSPPADVLRVDGALEAGPLHGPLLAQAAARPDAPAVVSGDGVLTFGELHDHAATVARRLREIGLDPGEPVAISLPRGPGKVVAALGVLLADAPFLALDPELPAERRAHLLTVARCRTVLCADRDAGWADGVWTVVPDGRVDAHAPFPRPYAAPGDLAYLTVTADPDGEPAVVAVSHRAALITCADVTGRFGVGPDDRVLGVSPPHVDLSVYDVFGVLGAGGALVLPEPDAADDPGRWAELVRAHRVTIWNSDAASAARLVEHGEATRAGAPLRLVLLSGDRIPVALAERVHALAPEARVVGLGSASGVAIWSACHEIDQPEPGRDVLPFGTALRGRRVHVLNDRFQECPAHVTGELFLAGPGLAECYHGDPERTAARFVAHPSTGERLHRTGWLARRLPDGVVEVTGRDEAGAGNDRPPVPDVAHGDDRRLSDDQADAAQRLRTQIAALLRIDAADVPTTVALPVLGVDSLRAIQLRNQVQRELGVVLSMRTLLSSTVTIADLAVALAAEVSGDAAQPLPAVQPQPHLRDQPFGLTDLQQAYLIGRSPGLDLGGVSTYFYAESAGEHDVDRLVRAFQAVVDRHDMLRATVTPDGEQQVLADPPPVPVRRYDLRGAGTEAVDEHLTRLRAEMAQQVLPLGGWPLFDLRLTLRDDGGSPVVHVHLGCDMLIADVWSIGLMLREWEAYYHQDDPGLRPLSLTFRDYLAAARRVQDGPRALRARRYWQSRLDELPAAPELPLRAHPAPAGPPVFDRRDIRLDPRRWEALKRHAAAAGLTPNAVLVAVLAAVVGQWSRTGRFLLNLPTFNRLPLHDEVDAIIGDFTSVTLLDVDLRAAATVGELARRVHARLVEDLDHREYSGVQVLRELSRRRTTGQPFLAPVVFTSALGQGGDDRGDLPTGWLGTPVYGRSTTPQVLLDNQVYEVEGTLVVHWDLVAGMFPPGVVDAMFDSYQALLGRVCDAEGLAATLDLTPTANRELVRSVNATDGPVPAGLLHDRIVDRVRREPERPAVVGPDGDLTYGELYRRAAQVAAHLRAAGVERNHLVAVALRRGVDQVVAALSVLLAGGAYVPIDPDLPAARRELMLDRSGCRLVLREEGNHDWPVGVRSVGWPVGSGGVVELMGVGGSSSDVAYVIFTSGSTGEPKGVVVSHRAAVNTVVEVCERFGVGVGDRVLGLSSLSFDLSVFDVFGVLGVGGVLVLPGVGDRRDPAVWWELVSRYSVSVWNSVPALAQMFVDYVAGLGVSSVPLRLVLVSGDWVPLGLPGAVWSVAPGCRVVSLGGATEAAVWSIAFEVEGVDAGWESVPYGRPLRNQRFHVLNDRWQECPVYVVGELFIGGVGLADGYVGDAELTGRRFVVHPVSGERLYRTGDLGRWRPDGLVEFVGREDLQVKVGGYRIELGEIEQVLTGHPLVREAVVTAPGDRHHRRLVGYVQPGPDAPDEPTLTANVLEHLRQRLPAYMIPTSLVVLPAFPLTANGKVDRKALPDPAATAPATTPADAGDATAARLVTIVSEIIGVGGIDTSRSFFEFGGDSVSGVQIVSRANAEGIDLTLQDLFELQTIDQIAAALRARGSSSPGGQRAGEPFPLTAYQRIVLNREAAVATHRLELAVAADTDSERVRQVVVTLLDRHPALRLRMTRDADSRFQVAEAVDPSAGYVPFIGLGALPEARRREAADAMVEELAAELDPASGQVFSAALFDLGAPDRLLVCLAHRFAVDDAAWQVLVGEVTALLAGEALPPTPSARFESWATAALRDAPPEPAATGYAGEQVPAPTAGPPATGPTHTLPPAETGALVEAAATAYRMRPDEVLFAAALRSLASWARPASTGPAGIRVDLERDGRRMFAHLDADGAVGCFVLAESIPADLARTGDDVRATLLAAKDTYRTATPGHHGGGVLLRWLGELSAPPARPGAPPGLVVTGALVDGALVVSWDGTVAAADLRVLAEATAAELRRIAEHCATADDRVVGRSDFPLAGLDDAELATLLGNLDGDSA
ncbi:non-ribosomal peptide synthetase [Salinispora arenicola]|uniref:non-ribosomal peptide synthetase n=2 Tax=Salinispora arenicola TaxID=168697 RepID=UPI0006851749|nr:non-ribosomal peptide synthetase [Salinispora arenicola]